MRIEFPDYPWLRVRDDMSVCGDLEGTTAAEADRRLIIVQEISEGRLIPVRSEQVDEA